MRRPGQILIFARTARILRGALEVNPPKCLDPPRSRFGVARTLRLELPILRRPSGTAGRLTKASRSPLAGGRSP